MRKLLAVLAVVGIFGIAVGTASAKSTTSIKLPTYTQFCVAGVTVTPTGDNGPALDLFLNGAIYFNVKVATNYPEGWTILHHWVPNILYPYGIALGDPSDAHVTGGPCPVVRPAPEPARIAYCSVAGNTWPNGTPIPAGTFLNLLAGQPNTDAHYTGATPAFWVDGVGLTCSLNPAQAALAAASTTLVGGGGTPFPAGLGGIYTFIPSK